MQSKKKDISISPSLTPGVDGRYFWDGSYDVPFDEWIETIRPSALSSRDCSWIQVELSKKNSDGSIFSLSSSSPSGFIAEEYYPALNKISQLVRAGKRVPSLAKNECVQSLISTAKKQNETVGKWMLFVPPTEADEVWGKIARATISGQLGTSAKISPAKGRRGGRDGVVCCIYVDDFTCRATVQRVLNALFGLGFVVTSGFKPDFYTELGIYSNNELGLSPTLYSVKEVRSWDLSAECTRVKSKEMD